MKPLAIIIPVKSPVEGKSRLKAVLNPAERYELNVSLFTHTFAQASELAALADVYVVSKSNDVLDMAKAHGFATISEPDHSDLNAAAMRAARMAYGAGALEVMVVPVDLPWLTSDSLRELITVFRETCDVMIVSDCAGDGTNVLLWRPSETAKFAFGVDSARRHADIAAQLGLRVVTRRDERLSFDLDTPQDLRRWQDTKGK